MASAAATSPPELVFCAEVVMTFGVTVSTSQEYCFVIIISFCHSKQWKSDIPFIALAALKMYSRCRSTTWSAVMHDRRVFDLLSCRWWYTVVNEPCLQQYVSVWPQHHQLSLSMASGNKVPNQLHIMTIMRQFFHCSHNILVFLNWLAGRPAHLSKSLLLFSSIMCWCAVKKLLTLLLSHNEVV